MSIEEFEAEISRLEARVEALNAELGKDLYDPFPSSSSDVAMIIVSMFCWFLVSVMIRFSPY